MATAALIHRHVFGIKGDVREPVAFIDEQSVLYPAGHNTVIYSMENRTQKFLPGTEKTEEITAVAVSPNKKFAAVAEKSDKGAITVFDLHSLKRRRLLTATDSLSKEFVSLAFSPDSKQLMAQGGAPDWALTIWTWEKAKFVATIKTAPTPNSIVCQCSFSPKDNNLICVTGNSVFKQFKLVDSNLKPLPNALNKREPQNYLCHAWLGEERVVLGTDTGDLLVIDGSELKAFLPRAPTDSNSIESVIGFSKVPLVLTANGGLLIFISLCIAAFCLAPRCLSFYRIILSSSAAFTLSLANPNIPTSPPCCSDFTSPDPFLFSPRLVRQGLVTGSDDGSIAIYEKSEDKDLFRRTKARRRCPPPTPPPATRGDGLSVEGRRQSPPLSG